MWEEEEREEINERVIFLMPSNVYEVLLRNALIAASRFGTLRIDFPFLG